MTDVWNALDTADAIEEYDISKAIAALAAGFRRAQRIAADDSQARERLRPYAIDMTVPNDQLIDGAIKQLERLDGIVTELKLEREKLRGCASTTSEIEAAAAAIRIEIDVLLSDYEGDEACKREATDPDATNELMMVARVLVIEWLRALWSGKPRPNGSLPANEERLIPVATAALEAAAAVRRSREPIT